MLAILPLLVSTTALASVGLRLNGSLGAWNGSFEQSDGAGHEVELRTLTSLGLEFGAGVSLGIAFVEYNFAWLISNHTLSLSLDPNATNNPSNREGPYFAPLGLNAGLIVPLLPIEPYIGIERASFGFSSSDTGYSGVAGKIGLNILITSGFGLRAEYRRHFIGYDDAGKLPSDITARFNSWYVGIVGGKF